MKKRYIGAGLIILGFAVLCIPSIKKRYEDNSQKKILEEWKDGLALIDSDEEETAESGTQGSSNQKKKSTGKENTEQTVGILKIPAIELEQPILEGATKQNLDISPATIEPTGRPGEEGNFAVAGHNSRTYGRHFNRISELQKEDEILVVTPDGTYSYQVTESFIVEAEDTWVLEPVLDGEEITLITCHYPKEGETQRLIVKGLRQQD